MPERYRLIIAGSRGWQDYPLMVQRTRDFKNLFIKPTGKRITIISGTAPGADKMGERLAEEFKIPVIPMPANWNRDEFGNYDRAAGYKRNEEMAKIADGCIVFWDGRSKGSFHMMNIAHDKHLDLWIIKPDGSIHRSPGEVS